MSYDERARGAEILVTGATGFVGRWLLAALTRRGRSVAALVRGAREREAELSRFVARLGGDAGRLTVVEGDVEAPGLGLSQELPAVRVVYHLAARFAFGLGAEDARRANVDGTRHALAWAARRPALARFVFLGGYRMSRVDPAALDEEALRAAYASGAYEGSKFEAHAAFRARARELGVPWTAVHPSSVIGDSRTGETVQLTGLGDTVKRLYEGELPALAGSPRTFVPVVTVDYLAEYLATVPESDATVGRDLVVFDPASPPLFELLARVAQHLGVALPRRAVPVSILRALPSALTGVHRESLGFLSEDRYDTAAGDAHAAAMKLRHPPLAAALARWCEHLVATRFLEQPPVPAASLRGGIFTAGDPSGADVVLLHGLPFDAEAMAPLAQSLDRESARIDLPGLGRSGPSRSLDRAWLGEILGPRRAPAVLVGHSLGAGVAVEHAAAHPRDVSALVLIAPAFLTAPAPLFLRFPRIVALALARLGPAEIERRLVSGGDPSPAAIAARAALSRRGGALRVARALAAATAERRRAALRGAIGAIAARGLPMLIVHAAREPLVVDVPGAEIVCIEGAGHNPHLTHTAEVAAAVNRFLAKVGTAKHASTDGADPLGHAPLDPRAV
ncbi:alpha/beta fold hydrolase [Sorangium sp. So ce375]|uniref:alpha/beta fold hydrolase n=1 Tax=Sorangium sp. So ce375 TaxID=3133306 RepID=UPI003F5B5CD2